MSDLSFVDKKILVVGGAGFVGSTLVRQVLKQKPSEIIVIDNLISADISNVPLDPKIRFINRSITDEQALSCVPDDLDFVFHLACFHGNQSSIEDPIADHQNNTLTSLKLFERLRSVEGLKKVVYAAAGCAVAEKTYGDAEATTEDAPVNMFQDSPYSISKLVGEFYGNYYFTRHGLPFVKARFQNVYGPGEILGAGQWRGTPHTVWRNVVPTFVFRALNGQPLQLDNGGDVSRDFIFVEDIARGLMRCALAGQPGEAYNLATGQETTIKDLAETINVLTMNKAPVDLRPARDWDSSGRRFGDPKKARNELGFEASVRITEGVKRTVKWTTENMDLIQSCMAQHRQFLPDIDDYLDR
jgi:nucleoside-diphosphate-sugar epimerase